MEKHWSRRQLLQHLAAASGAVLIPPEIASAEPIPNSSNPDTEIQIAPVSSHTFRLSVLPIENGQPVAIPGDGSLVQKSWDLPIAKLRGEVHAQTIRCGDLSISISLDPLTLLIANAQGRTVQTLTVDSKTGVVSFVTGDLPLLGLGEGGPQFDRRGSTDLMISGQGAIIWLHTAEGCPFRG